MKIMELNSNVIKPNPKSKSLRTTIPKEIINILKLNCNDKLQWDVEACDNELKVSVSKSE
jgi:hypothetical protein